MDTLLEALLNAGIAGVVIALMYVLINNLIKSHQKDRAEAERRHRAERAAIDQLHKEERDAWQKSMEKIADDFNKTVNDFNNTLANIRVDIAKDK